jgi:hypothetical protein
MGKAQEPLTISLIEAEDNHHPLLNDPAASSHLGDNNHQD